MEFYEYTANYQAEKNNRVHRKKIRKMFGGEFPCPRTYYSAVLKLLKKKADETSDTAGIGIATVEMDWFSSGRPYYKVYPSISQMLTKLDIDSVGFAQIPQPLSGDAIQLQFKRGSKFIGKVESMLFRRHTNSDGSKNYIWAVIDTGEKHRLGNSSSHFVLLIGESEEIIGDVLDRSLDASFYSKATLTREDMRSCLKLVCTLCLLGDSPELIQPEVLNADEHKLNGQHNIEALVAKARRRGKYGFTIGKDIEVMPHYRRPHLALVWYGPGKKKSKIIPRKGSIVHRSKVEKIPTGYAAAEAGA